MQERFQDRINTVDAYLYDHSLLTHAIICIWAAGTQTGTAIEVIFLLKCKKLRGKTVDFCTHQFKGLPKCKVGLLNGRFSFLLNFSVVKMLSLQGATRLKTLYIRPGNDSMTKPCKQAIRMYEILSLVSWKFQL